LKATISVMVAQRTPRELELDNDNDFGDDGVMAIVHALTWNVCTIIIIMIILREVHTE
jgi:hypothetical protein